VTIALSERQSSETMLDRLLAPMTIEEFFQSYWAIAPVHISGHVSKVAQLFSVAQLAVLLAEANPERLIIRSSFDRGASHVSTPPAEAMAWFNRGATLCIQGLESVCEELAGLIRAVREELLFSGTIDVRVYLSPVGQGFQVHFDRRIATTLQIEGMKRWNYSTEPALEWPHFQIGVNGEAPDSSEWSEYKRAEDCSFRDVVLQPGDILCLPAGCWHSAVAVQGHSLALNLAFESAGFWGILGPTLSSVLQKVPVWRCPPPPILTGRSVIAASEQLRTYMDTRIADVITLLEDLRANPEALIAMWMDSCGIEASARPQLVEQLLRE
jgi:ribosomal protein L16 Arg81 hydroxylase